MQREMPWTEEYKQDELSEQFQIPTGKFVEIRWQALLGLCG
jgi:hypothetical protein